MEMGRNEQANAGEGVVASTTSKSFSLSGLIQVFTSPGEFFGKLKDSPKILVPYLVIIIMSILGAYLANSLITHQRIKEMNDNPKLSAILEQQRAAAGITQEQFVEKQVTQGAYGIIIARGLAPLVIGGLLLFFGRFIMGGTASFKQVLSLVLYTEFLFVVGFVFVAGLMALKGSAQVSFSPAMFIIKDGMMSTLFVALSQLSLFHIWQIVVLGIGSSKIFGISSNKGYVVSVLSIGTIILLNIAMVSVMNAFLG